MWRWRSRSAVADVTKFSGGLFRECFSEISQNFRSAGYMPSARSILLQNSKNHLTILRLNFLCSNLEVKFSNLSCLNLHRKNVKLKNVRRDSAG